MPQFQEFERKAAYRTSQPKITIQRGGTMSLNAAAVEKLRREGESEEDSIPAVLLYDPSEKIVGLRRAAPDSPNVYEIRKQPGSVSYLVSGQAFAKHHGINTAKARRYDARMYGEGVIGFSLNDEHQVVTRGGVADD